MSQFLCINSCSSIVPIVWGGYKSSTNINRRGATVPFLIKIWGNKAGAFYAGHICAGSSPARTAFWHKVASFRQPLACSNNLAWASDLKQHDMRCNMTISGKPAGLKRPASIVSKVGVLANGGFKEITNLAKIGMLPWFIGRHSLAHLTTQFRLMMRTCHVLSNWLESTCLPRHSFHSHGSFAIA